MRFAHINARAQIGQGTTLERTFEAFITQRASQMGSGFRFMMIFLARGLVEHVCARGSILGGHLNII